MRSGILIGALLFTLAASPAAGQEAPSPAGRIKIASGATFVVRGGQELPARAGDALFESDTLRTGDDGRLGIMLADDTRVSLGPGSEMQVSRFVYAPASSQFGVVLRLVRGVAAYVSGRIAKLAPDSIRLETPAAIVGVRGTALVLRAE
jgi:hypothetical protein